MEKEIIVTWKKDQVTENWGEMVGLYANDMAEAWAVVKDNVANINLIYSVRLGKKRVFED